MKSIAISPYAATANNLLCNKINITSRMVDDSKVIDHHAIIPAEQPLRLSELNAEERNIFDLDARRFLATYIPVLYNYYITLQDSDNVTCFKPLTACTAAE